jgi:hypothetical protein
MQTPLDPAYAARSRAPTLTRARSSPGQACACRPSRGPGRSRAMLRTTSPTLARSCACYTGATSALSVGCRRVRGDELFGLGRGRCAEMRARIHDAVGWPGRRRGTRKCASCVVLAASVILFDAGAVRSLYLFRAASGAAMAATAERQTDLESLFPALSQSQRAAQAFPIHIAFL